MNKTLIINSVRHTAIKMRVTIPALQVVLCAMLFSHGAVADSFTENTPDLVDLPEVPPGFEVSLFARDPLVRNPCAMAFDAKGRMFISMGPQYRNPTPETPPDSVIIMLDTDGDGVADKTKVFATGFNCIQGLAWHGRDLWVANSPDLTIVRDLDGDDEADEYALVYTDLGNLEHGLHGLVWAPDGKLYMSKGNSKGLTQPDRFAPKPFRDLWGVTAPVGTPDFYAPRIFKKGEYRHAYHDPKDDWGREGGTLRCDDLGKNLEVVARGFRNPWDIVFDAGFNWLGTDNDQKEGDRIVMPFYGAHFGWSHAWSANWTGQDHLPTVPISGPVFQGSGTGVIFYDAPQFPENFRHVFFINDWLRKTIFVYRPRWDGALIQPEGGNWEEFARGSKALFRPTDMEVGPDGAIYCLGWGRGYGSEVTDNEMINEGRIFQFKWKATPLIPRAMWYGTKRDKPLAQWTVAQLIEDFSGALPVWHIDAQDELVRRGSAVTNELIKTLRGSKLSDAQETWAAWTLGRIAPGDVSLDEFFASNMRSAKSNLRIQSIRILAHRLREAHGAKTLPAILAELLKAPEPRLRFEAVQAIWQAKQTQFAGAVKELAAEETDRLTFYSAWHALRDFSSVKDLTAMLADSRGGVRRAALLALLDLKALTARQVTTLADDPDTGTKEVARLWLAKTAAGGDQAIIRGQALDKGRATPPPPTQDDFIQRLQANSKTVYKLIPNGLKSGARAYTDRTSTFSSVPAALTNLSYIQAASEDVGLHADEALSFESALPLTIFVGYDARMTAPPKWMKVGQSGGFSVTDLIVATPDTSFRIFQKDFPAGDIVLGGSPDSGAEAARARLVIYKPLPLKAIATPTTIAQALGVLNQGNRVRGEQLFMHSAGAGCFNCHRVENRGNDFAPNLTGLGDRTEARHIIESMLEPNAVITEGFNSHNVETDDADYSGMLAEETDFFLTLIQANGQPIRIEKGKIKNHQSQRSSAMPSFAEMLTPTQVADITVWLLSQKSQTTNTPVTNQK